jgi:hypothetical protein
MTDFEVHPVGTGDELKRLKQEIEKVRAELETIKEGQNIETE